MTNPSCLSLAASLVAVFAPVAFGNITVSSLAPTTDIILSDNVGGTFSRIFDEDTNTNHARGQLFYLPTDPGEGYQITGITIHKNSAQTFSNDTLTVRIIAGTPENWETGTGHDTPTDGNNYYVDTSVTELYLETYTIDGLVSGNDYVTFEFATPVIVADDSNLGFLITYDQSTAASPEYFQYNEGSSGQRIQVTTTGHNIASSRHMRHFILGSAFDESLANSDDDMDGLTDLWELIHFGNFTQTGTGNPDGDGLDNTAEEDADTNPNLPDTDNDGLNDDIEVAGITDPLDPDSDDDNLLDGIESGSGRYLSPNDTGTNPLLPDTDGDNINDDIEISLGSDPFDSTHQPSERPNIIFIMLDDLDTQEIGVYGQATLKTPRVDTMAAQGMMFTNYYTASPVCQSCRSSLLTGQDSRRSHDRHNSGSQLNPARVTVAEILKGAGYTTGCVGKWGVGGSTGAPWNQGFDFFCGYLSQTNAHRFFPLFLWRNQERIYFDQTLADANNAELYLPGAQNFNIQTRTWDDAVGNVCSHDVVVSEGLQFIEDNADNPFFLYCAWTPPHAFFYNAATVEALTDADGLIYDHNDPDQTLLEELYPGAPFGTDDQGRPEFVPHVYATMVSAADRDTGRIIDKLYDPNGDGDTSDSIADNTLVIFCSDNGEDEPTFLTPEHLKPGFTDFRGLKRDTYEGGIRAPFIAWWPGKIPAGSTSDVIGTFADMLPTFAHAAGVSSPSQVTGRSILPALLGGDESSLEPRNYHYWSFTEGSRRWRAVRQGDWKIVRDRATGGAAPTYELFNLANDPLEANNLSGSEAALLNRLIPLVEGSHEPTLGAYFKVNDEFFTKSNLTESAFQIDTPDGTGTSNGYSLVSSGTGHGFNYLPFETGLSEPTSFNATLQFPSGGAGSFLLSPINDPAQALAVRINSDTLLLEVLHQGSLIANDSFTTADFSGNRAELTLVLDPNNGVGEVQLGSFALSFNLGTAISPLQFWGYQVESTTLQTSRPQWQIGTGLNGTFCIRMEPGSILGDYQLPLSAGNALVPQFSYDLKNWFDNPPGLIDLRSTGSQGEVSGLWTLPDDSLLPRSTEQLFFRYRSEGE
ncbi:MAG: sulfatase-like hydrolase/transferase [Roseibacillus sp.]